MCQRRILSHVMSEGCLYSTIQVRLSNLLWKHGIESGRQAHKREIFYAHCTSSSTLDAFAICLSEWNHKFMQEEKEYRE